MLHRLSGQFKKNQVLKKQIKVLTYSMDIILSIQYLQVIIECLENRN